MELNPTKQIQKQTRTWTLEISNANKSKLWLKQSVTGFVLSLTDREKEKETKEFELFWATKNNLKVHAKIIPIAFNFLLLHSFKKILI